MIVGHTDGAEWPSKLVTTDDDDSTELQEALYSILDDVYGTDATDDEELYATLTSQVIEVVVACEQAFKKGAYCYRYGEPADMGSVDWSVAVVKLPC
jgi:hypothetical protein